MIENLFSPSPQIWTALVGGLVALPIVIHLINLMRHQKVEWAAMEFLLMSHQKNRNWVWLKQLLLLASRIAALLLTLFMLAQMGCHEDRISKLLGSATTHHYVLLDDSFSMSDNSDDGTAFDRAVATISLIAARAENRQNQRFTLLRFSKCTNEDRLGVLTSIADINGELVDNQFARRLEKTKSEFKVSTLAVDFRESLAIVSKLVEDRVNENAIIYILSDFRAKDWTNPQEIDRQLAALRQSGAATELINCVKTERPNLTISDLSPSGSVRVAGTPLMMRLTVSNPSSFSAENIQIQIETQTYPGDISDSRHPENEEPLIVELPTVFIESLGAGQTESQEFPVVFATTGQHAIKATLGTDAVQIDNTKWAVVSFSSTSRILIIDHPEQSQGRFLALAINPGGMTGLTPEIRTADYLRDATIEQLNKYDVVFLLDVNRLDDRSVRHLENYTASGGGVGVFVGPKTDLEYVTTQLYRNGSGLFPLPLEKTVEIQELFEDRIPDIALQENSLFPAGMRNPLMDLVQIKKVIRPPLDWQQNRSRESRVAATVRGVDAWPLIVFQPFGRGNVMAFLSTAGPLWNNWCRNGTFPPTMLLVEDQLAKGRFQIATDVVGIPIPVSAEPDEFGPDVVFLVPNPMAADDDVNSRVAIEQKMQLDNSTQKYETELGASDTSDLLSNVLTPGIYDVWRKKTSSQWTPNRLALNVDTGESEMALVNQQSLLAAFESSRPVITNWDQFNPEPRQTASSSITRLLLFFLIGILIVEPILAFSTSYHAKIRTTSRPLTQLGTGHRDQT